MEEMIKVSITHASDTESKDFRTPMTINETLKSKYGDSWTLFLPETLRQSIRKDLNVTVGNAMMNKIQATQTVLLNPYFDWDIFENVCLAFNDVVPSFLIIEGMSMMELTWGFVCIKALHADYRPTEDIESYITTTMKCAGHVWNPWIGYEIGSPSLVEQVKEVWKSGDKFTSDPSVGIQVDRLTIIRDYVKSWE
jgi:hypothetical protein